METILFLAHTEEDGSLAKSALETLSAAVDLKNKLTGSKLAVGVIGASASAAINTVGECKADKFFEVSGPDFGQSRYSSDAAAIEAIARAAGATVILYAATSRFNRVVPGVVQRLGGRIDTRINGVLVTAGVIQIQRWYYRQRMMATLSRTARPWFLAVETGIFQPFNIGKGNVSIQKIDIKLGDSLKRTKVIGLKAPSTDAQTIRPDAKLLFVAGAGWTKKQSDGQVHTQDAAKLILEFLERTSASLGSSKSLVDLSGEGQSVFSFMSHLNQVGQTGSTPRHAKGLSTCCHGEEPHAVGWRFINERRAVNLDPNCGWAQGKTDVLYVADAFQVIAKVNELLA